MKLNAIHSSFTTFCEGPQDIEKGYNQFFLFHRKNYLSHLPQDKKANILVVSSGVGYFQNSLKRWGYENVVGIDSDVERVAYAKRKGFQSECVDCFDYLADREDVYDFIFTEQEVNHLTRDEFLSFLTLAYNALQPGGKLMTIAANCANPIIATEYLGNNIDHYTSFTENNMRQYFSLTNFSEIQVIPHDFYVLWYHPMNYVAKGITGLIHTTLRVLFKMYGKSNQIFTKRLSAIFVK